MKDPEQALAAARQAALRAGEPALDEAPWRPEGKISSARRLTEWAIIEPEPTLAYSTRPYGAPITWLKQLMIRLLGQYLGQISAQQSRFNSGIAAHVLRLEERVAELEREAAERQTGDTPDR